MCIRDRPYANLPATTTGVAHQLLIGVTSGAAVDITFDLYWPQLEQGEFATSPILPPVGTVAASTRAADLLNVPLSRAMALILMVTAQC